MNVDLEHLVVLAAQDVELARLRREVAESPARVQAAERRRAELLKEVSTGTESLAKEARLQRGHESDIAQERAKLQRLRRSLDGATSATQVTAFEHEIQFGEAAIAREEEAAFLSLERSEELERQLEARRAELGAAERAVEEAQARGREMEARHRETIAGIERERAALREQVSPEALAGYDRLARAKGTAVAEALGSATGGKCSACQMAVRPQRWSDLTSGDHDDQIFHCESCGRMLFWDPRRDTPRPWLAGDRLASAHAAAGKGAAR